MTLDPNGILQLYASDLQRFSACKHASHLDLRRVHGEELETAPESEDIQLLSQLGNEHERGYLKSLVDAGKTVVSIQRGPDAVQQTVAALKNGVDVVYQAVLERDQWKGYVDFLERIETPSALGDYSYEVVDTKLKRVPDPKHILQLIVYSDLLYHVQELQPEYGHLQLGQGERSTHRLAEYTDYVRQIRDRLVTFVESPGQTKPRRCSECDLCRWRIRCADQWEQEDSLYMVAGIRGSQIGRLETAGIQTMTQLAQLTKQDAVAKIAPETLQNLHTQARLQVARRNGGAPASELRPYVKGKGFDLLPDPDPGDLFYDIEGNPHYRENGEERLEYLHGIWYRGQFKALWAHNHDEECQRLKDLFEFFQQQIEQFPNSHIYHYAPYEITALRRLTTKYSFGEDRLDGWQREKRFVDLYAVVRGGIFASEKNYSLKSLEAFYMQSRSGSVTTAAGSIVAYNNWRLKWDANDPSAAEDLKELEHYNQIDCESTEKLRDWLISLRSSAAVQLTPTQLGTAQTARSRQQAEQNEALLEEIRASSLPSTLKQVLMSLGLFHYREKKPQAWAVFDASKKAYEEMLEDTDCLVGLQAITDANQVKRSVEREYEFPTQYTKMTSGKSASILSLEGQIKTVQILELNPKAHRITLKIGGANAAYLSDKLDLLPPMPINTNVIENAIYSLIQQLCAGTASPATVDLLERNAPNLVDPSILSSHEGPSIPRMQQAVKAMCSTVLTVQGPPGTGKTFVSSRAILSLVQQGSRVAISSNSHEAIRNLLMGCENAAREENHPIRPAIIHKISRGSAITAHPGIEVATKNDDPGLFSADIVGGTAWLFCRPEMADLFDYLFVDEAGQVSLANLFGMSMCADNLVLIGDPCQLPQVIQASHPDPANLSCLEWMLGDHRLIMPGRGIFLEETWRMHPKLCRYNSTQFYEGRLLANPSTEAQAIQAPPLPEAGAYLVPVVHQEHRAQQCEEEGHAMNSVIHLLLEGTWKDRHQVTDQIQPSDIIVVAPFNAQVNLLREVLPDMIRVGTVDKFQGQEAAVALVSMTSTSANETPRGMDFLLSRERINVALSRAKVLSLVFASPALLESSCSTTLQIRLVNALCALETLNLEL